MRLRLLLAVAFLPLAISAHADTIQTFNLAGIFDNLTTVTGTLTVDTTTGTLLGASSTYLGNTYNVVDASGYSPASQTFIYFQSQSTTSVYPVLIFGLNNTTSLVNYTASLLCSETNPCNGLASSFSSSPGTFTYLSFGYVSPQIAITPEPSGLALLGTGLLGVLGMARRRLASW